MGMIQSQARFLAMTAGLTAKTETKTTEKETVKSETEKENIKSEIEIKKKLLNPK